MNFVFHLLTPIKEVETGWFKLKWKPIKNGTWNFYLRDEVWRYRTFRTWFLGIKIYTNKTDNGWGRGYDSISVDLGLIFFTASFWINYNLICMAEGAMDEAERKPLDFSKSKLKNNK